MLLAGPRGRAADDTYLRRALAIGESPRFDVTATALDAVTDDALARAHVVIVNDAPLADAVIARLAAFAERGGGVLVVAGSRASWPQGAAMPGHAGRRRSTARARPGGWAASSTATRSSRRSARRAAATSRACGSTATAGSPPAADARVLARFDDGQPALVERTVGAGRMLVWTSGFDLAWNDLALKPVFLPFVHQLVRTLAAFRERPTSLTVGQVAALDRRADGGASRVAVEPSGTPHAARSGARRRPRGDDAGLLRGAVAGPGPGRRGRGGGQRRPHGV